MRTGAEAYLVWWKGVAEIVRWSLAAAADDDDDDDDGV
jgi:hypothetical protein